MTSSKNSKPYISFVAVSRNDNYGGNLVQEVQIFIDSLAYLSEKYQLPSELVFVDWNPPADKPKLKDSFKLPSSSAYLKTVFVEVPSAVHKSLKDSERFFLFEYIAKNAGIRRARGEYILVTNPDNFFAEEIIAFIAKRKLREDAFYRIGRANLKYPVPLELKTYAERLGFARKNIDYFNCFIKVCRNTFVQKYNPLRWAKNFVFNFVIPSLTHFPLQAPAMNAPGDFILMHRENWLRLKGFQQFSPLTGKAYSAADGLMVYQALSAGLKHKYLSHPLNGTILYSQPQSQDKFTASGPSYLEEYLRLFRQMRKERKPIMFNDENWGLGSVDLPQT